MFSGSSNPLFVFCRAFVLDSSIKFLAVNADLARRIDADANLVDLHAEDREGDIRADHYFFAGAARHD